MVKRRPKASLTSQLCGRAPRVRPRAFPERTLVMSKKITIKADSKKSNEPRLVGSIVSDVLQSWNRSTELSVNLKTILRSDARMETDKDYLGVLRRDSDREVDEFLYHDPHFTFTEVALPSSSGRRNVHLYEGRHITCTKRLNGTLRLNFKNLKLNADFDVDSYAFEVANEIREALSGLVEK